MHGVVLRNKLGMYVYYVSMDERLRPSWLGGARSTLYELRGKKSLV